MLPLQRTWVWFPAPHALPTVIPAWILPLCALMTVLHGVTVTCWRMFPTRPLCFIFPGRRGVHSRYEVWSPLGGGFSHCSHPHSISSDEKFKLHESWVLWSTDCPTSHPHFNVLSVFLCTFPICLPLWINPGVFRSLMIFFSDQYAYHPTQH